MSKIKKFLEDLEAAKTRFPEEELPHIRIILACCTAFGRYPTNVLKHLEQMNQGFYGHICGLNFTGYEKGIPYKAIAEGVTQFIKKEKSINIENWLIELQDFNRQDIIVDHIIDTESERLALIEKYKSQGYTHQLYCNDLNVIFNARKQLQFHIIGKLTSEDVYAINTGVTIFYYNEAQTECECYDFINSEALGQNLKEWAYANRVIVHPDLLYYWESVTEKPVEIKPVNKSKILRKLYDFQDKGVDVCSAFKKTLLADDMGLGKTTQAIATIEANNAWPCLFVVPPVVLYNWQNEIKQVLGIDCIIVTNKNLNDAVGAKAVIITYNTAENMALYADQFQSIVVDESHNVKDKSTKRYKAILNLAMGKEWRILLTGTPILNRTSELIPQLTILGYLNEETSNVFRREYCQKQPNRFALERLNIKLRNMCMVRRNKQDVDIQLPPVTRTIIEAEITNRKQYNLANEDIRNYLEKIKKLSADQITKAMRAETLTRTSHLKKVAAEGYREDVVEFCQNALVNNQSVLLFCGTHTAMDYYQKALGTDFRIDGTVSKIDKQRLVDRYQASDKPEVFIIGIRSGGVGITLTKADIVIHAEKDWVPLMHDQATSRTHRIGRVNHVNEYFFVARDTIDKRIMDIMEEKRFIAEAGTGAMDIASQVTTSVYKEVMFKEFGYVTANVNDGSEEPDPV